MFFMLLERQQCWQCQTLMTSLSLVYANAYGLTTGILQYIHLYFLLNNKIIKSCLTHGSSSYNLNKLQRTHLYYQVLPTHLRLQGIQKNCFLYHFEFPLWWIDLCHLPTQPLSHSLVKVTIWVQELNKMKKLGISGEIKTGKSLASYHHRPNRLDTGKMIFFFFPVKIDFGFEKIMITASPYLLSFWFNFAPSFQTPVSPHSKYHRNGGEQGVTVIESFLWPYIGLFPVCPCFSCILQCNQVQGGPRI